MLFRNRFLLRGARLVLFGSLKLGPMGLLLMIGCPNSVFGGMHYSATSVPSVSIDLEGKKRDQRAGSQLRLWRESLETVLDGQVYRMQYVPPAMPPTSSQPNQSGVEAQAEQSRPALPAFVPFFSVAERYDSNVLFSEQAVHDYVTSIMPGGRWNIESAYMSGNLLGTIIAERYVLNPGLSYVGGSGVLDLDLERLAGQLIRNWSVRILDSVMYTPQQPAFLAPGSGNQLDSALIRGVQAARNKSLSNTASITSTLPVSPTMSIDATYDNYLMKFFADDVTLARGLFNVNGQTLLIGPRYGISPSHSIGLAYQFQHMSFSPVVGGESLGSVSTHGGMLTWRGTLSPLISAELGAGASVVLPDNTIQSIGRGSVQYTTSIMAVVLTYSRDIVPSYYISGGALLSDVTSLSVTYNLTDKWYVIGAYNYSKSRLITGDALQFESHGPLASVNYRITPAILASVSFNYFAMEYQTGEVASLINREVASLTIRGEWN